MADLAITSVMLAVAYIISVAFGVYLTTKLLPRAKPTMDNKMRLAIRDEIIKAAPHIGQHIRMMVRDDALNARVRRLR